MTAPVFTLMPHRSRGEGKALSPVLHCAMSTSGVCPPVFNPLAVSLVNPAIRSACPPALRFQARECRAHATWLELSLSDGHGNFSVLASIG